MTETQLANKVRYSLTGYHGHQWRNIKSVALMHKGWTKMPPGATAGMMWLPGMDGVIVYSSSQLHLEPDYKDAKIYWLKEGRADPPKMTKTKEARACFKRWGLTKTGKAVV